MDYLYIALSVWAFIDVGTMIVIYYFFKRMDQKLDKRGGKV